VLTRDMKKLAQGQVVYSAMCYEHGGMIDDGTVFRLGRDNFRWIGGDDYGGIWLREQAEKLGLQVMVRSQRPTSCTTWRCRARTAARS
jgi:aminomethyltransferase